MLLGERGPSEGVAGESCANPRGSAASSRSKLIFCICGAPVTDAGSGQQTVAGDSGASLMTEAIRAARLGVCGGVRPPLRRPTVVIGELIRIDELAN